MFKLWKIQNNVAVHGLEYAARLQQQEFKRNPTGANTFDTFYYALFGRWPARKIGGGK